MNNSLFPFWGPYGKKYAGASFLTEYGSNPARLDVVTVPGLMGGDIRVPDVTVPSGYHTFDAASDLKYYSFRHELEWKDVVFADVSYVNDGENQIIRTELVNNSDKIQNFIVNYFFSLELPVGVAFEPQLPKNSHLIDACDYDAFEYNSPRPWDEQNPDGFKKGEFSDCEFFRGHGLGDRAPKWHLPHCFIPAFGAEKGDIVLYKLKNHPNFRRPVIVIRYRSPSKDYSFLSEKADALFTLNGQNVIFPFVDELSYVCIELDEISNELELVSLGGGEIELDFLVLCELEDVEIITSKVENEAKKPYLPHWSVDYADSKAVVKAKYEGIEQELKLCVLSENVRTRFVETGNLSDCMSSRMSNPDESFDDLLEPFSLSFKRKHSDEGAFVNALDHTIFVAPGETAVRYAIVSAGDIKAYSVDELEGLYSAAKAKTVNFHFNPDGAKYELSNRLLSTATLTNVVYPIYKHGENIIHFTPGKRWDCLYTWDSGFIGLGLAEYAPKFSRYVLETYLSDETNPDYGFLHHGSPVPTQAYQFFELLQKENDKSKLLVLYPKLLHYYRCFTGKLRSITTAKFSSSLLTTYDYFYSSSGMDDYPPQVAMMKENKRGIAAPAISTATAIRFAKILLAAASLLNRTDENAELQCDIERFTDALNKFSWDEEAGYFSFVLHDENGDPISIYTTADGENLNKGLDGVYPLVCGICSEGQKQKLLSHLKSENEMLTPFGISAVDQSASYYRVNGYWNGNIWFAHQWVLFKAMLDMNEGGFAFEIAHRALNIWKREADGSYFTFEMVNTKTGNGGWFHNFGGLSTPINLWAKAYYSPGTVNAGFDTLILNHAFDDDFASCKLKVKPLSGGGTIVVVMAPGEYETKLNGKTVQHIMRSEGAVEIQLPFDAETVEIMPLNKEKI